MKRIPLGRHGEHQELANLAAYLLSDFSAYITGACITIDGGTWLRGAGQFNALEDVSREQWDELQAMMKPKKIDSRSPRVLRDVDRESSMNHYPSICVLGAGVSGLTMMKAPARSGHSLHDVRKERSSGGQLGLRQQERHVDRPIVRLHIDSSRLLDRVR